MSNKPRPPIDQNTVLLASDGQINFRIEFVQDAEDKKWLLEVVDGGRVRFKRFMQSCFLATRQARCWMPTRNKFVRQGRNGAPYTWIDDLGRTRQFMPDVQFTEWKYYSKYDDDPKAMFTNGRQVRRSKLTADALRAIEEATCASR